MKLTALILPTLSKVGFAQVDYSPDYNPSESGRNIARGSAWNAVRGQAAAIGRPEQTGNAFANLAGNRPKATVPPTLGPMDNEKFDTSGSGDKDEVSSEEIIGNIDLDALAQILIQGDKKIKPTQKPTTKEAVTTIKTINMKTKKPIEKNKKKTTTNREKWLANRPAGYKKQQKPNRYNYRGGENSAARYHSNAKENAITEAEQKAHERKLAAYKLARKIREHRAQQKEQQFSDTAEASGNAEGVASLGMRFQADDSGLDFSEYYDIEDFEDFYEYAESLSYSDIIDSPNATMDRIEIVGENRTPISCWTCKRTYWDPDSTGDLYDDCRRTGELVTCPQHLEDDGSSHFSSPMSCQITEHRFFGVVSELSVGCKQTRACDNNWKQNRMSGSVYGRSCRVESSFGTSKCRQCCEGDACYDGSEATLAQSLFDQDSEWFDQSNHATYITVGK